MAISPQGVIRSTSCLVLRWGFRGQRIEWRDFRFRQIQATVFYLQLISNILPNFYPNPTRILYFVTVLKHTVRRRVPYTFVRLSTIEVIFVMHRTLQLEVHGRARREAARRRKSQCKVNLGNRNSSRTNGS